MADTLKLAVPDHESVQAREITEAEWHIRNATVDVSSFIVGVPVGSQIADAEVFSPAGDALTLASLWTDQPALIVTGSLSCPPSRRLNPLTSRIAEKFTGRLNVAVLYVLDAHPSGDHCPYTGTDWVSVSNEDEKILIRQPRDQAERNSRALEYQERLRLTEMLLVDNMDNTAWAALGKSPNAAILVNTDGTCLVCQHWFEPDGLTDIVEQNLRNKNEG
jgi:hypothetical protein